MRSVMYGPIVILQQPAAKLIGYNRLDPGCFDARLFPAPGGKKQYYMAKKQVVVQQKGALNVLNIGPVNLQPHLHHPNTYYDTF